MQNLEEVTEQPIVNLVEKQQEIEALAQELAAWLDSHNAFLRTVSMFSPDGRLVTKIQVALKA